MADRYCTIRVHASTLRELERVKASMMIGEAMGLSKLTKPDGTRVSIETVLLRLVEFRDKHAARSRRSRSRRKGADKDADSFTRPAE